MAKSTKATAKPEAKAEPKPEPKPEPKVEAKVEAKAEAKPSKGTKAAPKAETKAPVKAEEKAPAKADAKAPAVVEEKTPAGPKAMTKTALYKAIADEVTGEDKVTPKQVSAVFAALAELIKKELGKKGTGVVKLPDLVKFERVEKPATKATEKPDPFRPGQMMKVKAKPKTIKVRVRPLKLLNEAINK